ncbi:hypothetical protein ACWGR4_39445 [Embleya sp. NPDC055664]
MTFVDARVENPAPAADSSTAHEVAVITIGTPIGSSSERFLPQPTAADPARPARDADADVNVDDQWLCASASRYEGVLP